MHNCIYTAETCSASNVYHIGVGTGGPGGAMAPHNHYRLVAMPGSLRYSLITDIYIIRHHSMEFHE